jgi:hypothetical protein
MESSKRLRLAVSDALVARGYERRGRALRRRIDDEWWSILDTASMQNIPDIMPWVGLRHEGVERVVPRCLELPFDTYSATVGAMSGYIRGRDRPDRMEEPATVEEVLARIDEAQAVLERYRSLDRLPDAFSIRGTHLPLYHFTLAAIHLLLGDEAGVRKWLAEGERTDCRQAGEVCEQFRRFERNILALMSGDPPWGRLA